MLIPTIKKEKEMSDIRIVKERIKKVSCQVDGENYIVLIKSEERIHQFYILIENCSDDFQERAGLWKRILILKCREYEPVILVDDGNKGNAVILKNNINSPGYAFFC